ncbi:hypothetical protein ABZW03_26235 [Kitasatospora sp. NPDC004799]|uniref:hypothetical protein n=1 Tax=Kitasatospora sp. NPDC004799 TaxID=3154460 RepID=UPI0033B26961
MNDTLNRTGWHFDARNGMTTRNPRPALPSGVTVTAALSLPTDELRQTLAAHEAGHVAVLLHFGIPFQSVYIRDDLGLVPDRAGNGGAVVLGSSWSGPLYSALVMLAAGERAQDRWLRENGRWNTARGWLTELGAIGDRREIYRAVDEVTGRDVTFGAGDDPCRDLAALHDHTDALLDLLWERVGRVADALNGHGQLTGEQAAEAAGVSLKAGWRR